MNIRLTAIILLAGMLLGSGSPRAASSSDMAAASEGPELSREVSYALDIPGNIVDRYRHETEAPELVLGHRGKIAHLIEEVTP